MIDWYAVLFQPRSKIRRRIETVLLFGALTSPLWMFLLGVVVGRNL